VLTVPEEEKIWDYVIPKDSINKEKGSLILSVYRGSKKQEFNYRAVVNEVKDNIFYNWFGMKTRKPLIMV
jgi:hypothetical protein